MKLEKLLEKSEEVQRVTQNLLERLEEVEDALIKVVEKINTSSEFLEKFDYEGIGLRWKRSNVGGHIYLTYRGKVIPVKPSNLGKGRYLHGDFNSWIDFCTREEVLFVAHNLRAYCEHFQKVLNTLEKETEEALEEIPEVEIK